MRLNKFKFLIGILLILSFEVAVAQSNYVNGDYYNSSDVFWSNPSSGPIDQGTSQSPQSRLINYYPISQEPTGFCSISSAPANLRLAQLTPSLLDEEPVLSQSDEEENESNDISSRENLLLLISNRNSLIFEESATTPRVQPIEGCSVRRTFRDPMNAFRDGQMHQYEFSSNTFEVNKVDIVDGQIRIDLSEPEDNSSEFNLTITCDPVEGKSLESIESTEISSLHTGLLRTLYSNCDTLIFNDEHRIGDRKNLLRARAMDN